MNTIADILKNTSQIYIFGAQSRAKTLMGYIHVIFPDIRIVGYLVDDEEKNESVIQSVPVWKLQDHPLLQTECPVMIATKGVFHQKICSELETLGFQIVIPVSVEVDNWLRNAYVKQAFATSGRSFIKLTDLKVNQEAGEWESKNGGTKPDICVYVAKSIYDRALEVPYEAPDYECYMQVGAALTSQRLGVDILTDDVGENISDRNRQYSELTGLYWFWKNRKHDIAGLAHYRRHFILPSDWEQIMVSNAVDVILPVPTYVYPSIEDNYRGRHIPEDWDFLMEYLQTYFPDDFEVARQVFRGSLYLPCNMLIARWEVLDELCSWMFPILDAVAVHGGVKEDTYMNRYVGFISERLITLFFVLKQETYNIAYADRIFLKSMESV
jgi:hypothetical protein